MKKLLLVLLFPSFAYAGNWTLASQNLMTITYSSATASGSGGGLSPKTFVQGSVSTTSGCGAQLASITTTAGHLLVMGCTIPNGNTGTTFTDGTGETWNTAVQVTGNPGIGIYYVKSAAGGATAPLANGTGCNAVNPCVMLEYSGNDGVSNYDVASSSVPLTTGLPYTTTAATTNFSNELMVAFLINGGGTAPTGQSGTARNTNSTVYSQDANVTPAGPYTSTWTTSVPYGWAAAQAAFK